MPRPPNPAAAWDVSPSMSALAPESTATGHAPTPADASSPGDHGHDFDSLFAAHYERLVRALTLVAGDPESAADAVQEAFVKAHLRWRRISRYDDPIGGSAGSRSTRSATDTAGASVRTVPLPGSPHAADDDRPAGRTRRVRAPARRPPQAAAGGDGAVLRRRAVDRRDRGRARHRGGIGEVAPARRPRTAQAAAREVNDR